MTLKLAVSADGKAGLAGRKPAAITGEDGARARIPDARGKRRHPGRHRHGAVRRSAIDLPPAGHVRALAGARRARREIDPAAGDVGRRDRARDADLGVHFAQAVADRRRNSSAEGLQGFSRRGERRRARSAAGAQGAGRAGHHAADGRGRAEGCGKFRRRRPGRRGGAVAWRQNHRRRRHRSAGRHAARLR